MPRVDESNRTDPSELIELFERSGLRAGSFAKLVGVPRTTFLDMVRPGALGPTRAVLNSARFVMLQLGHAIELKPIDTSSLRRRKVLRGRKQRD